MNTMIRLIAFCFLGIFFLGCASMTEKQMRSKSQCHAWMKDNYSTAWPVKVVDNTSKSTTSGLFGPSEFLTWGKDSKIVTTGGLVQNTVATYETPDTVKLDQGLFGDQNIKLNLEENKTAKLPAIFDKWVAWNDACSKRDAALAVTTVVTIANEQG